MSRSVPFQTRARTIDHLGRGQIADAPTAISELWKNSFDAYARNVGLHIFSGNPEVALIADDGRGMDLDDIENRWLVVGTESKIVDSEQTLDSETTFGLPIRVRQGEKGIGRLSAAFLAPATLVVSKKQNCRFSAVLVDWRLFENPFLLLDDIRLPLQEFDHMEEILELLPSMVATIRSNICDTPPPDKEDQANASRYSRLQHGWDRYTKFQGREDDEIVTQEAIRQTWSSLPIEQRHLEAWPLDNAPDSKGTCLFMIGIKHELAVWVRPGGDDEEAIAVKDKLRETLTGFTDPYDTPRHYFNYEVIVHDEDGPRKILDTNDVFGVQDFLELEHLIQGEFDEQGGFTGRVVAYGRDLGVKRFVPRRPPPKTGRDRLGSFKFCIGTFEQELVNTTHSEQQHGLLAAQAEKYAGIAVYRDGLRVMPYGRPSADFFELEERRGRHTGRYFWSYRRSFGRVAITYDNNPNLRDKAGREGLVDNRACREMKILVVGLLIDFANRFFGTDSPNRKEWLPEIIERNKAARAAAEKAKSLRRKSLRSFLNAQRQPLESALNESKALVARIERALSARDRQAAALVAVEYKKVVSLKPDLRPPPIPTKLGDLEERYREYRDAYREFCAGLDVLSKGLTEAELQLGSALPADVVKTSFHSNQSILSARVDGWLKILVGKLDALRDHWRGQAQDDRGNYYRICSPLLDDEVSGSNLLPLLNLLDSRKNELEEEFATKYEAFIRTLEQVHEGIDLDGALAIVEDDKTALEEKVRDLHAVAQVGITVEIIGHELDDLDAEVRRNLARLPDEARQLKAYKLASESQHALTERLRFLSPLKVAGYRPRVTITGREIANYIQEFFERVFRNNRIVFEPTEKFKAIKITDLPSRIYPVFINLINNAVYWVSLETDRRIKLDYEDQKVVVADSGRGVDPDDLSHLFELFFSRRRNGRGIGLYLARANLAVAGHSIRYAGPADPQVLGGANFIIEFRGVSTNG